MFYSLFWKHQKFTSILMFLRQLIVYFASLLAFPASALVGYIELLNFPMQILRRNLDLLWRHYRAKCTGFETWRNLLLVFVQGRHRLLFLVKFYLNILSKATGCKWWAGWEVGDPACNITICPVASEFGKKRQWGKLNQTLTCPARQAVFWAKSNLTFV